MKTYIMNSLQDATLHPMDPALKEFFCFYKKESNALLVCHQNGQNITSIVIFIDKNRHTILFTRKIRSSYYDLEGSDYLYEITYDKVKMASPEIKLYHFAHAKLKLLFIQSMAKVEEHVFEYFVDTPHHVILEMENTTQQSACIIKDGAGNVLVAETTANTITDPVAKFIALLEVLFNKDFFIHVDELVTAAVKQITQSESISQTAIRKLSCRPELFELLHRYRHKLYLEQGPFEAKVFIEKILSYALGMKMDQACMVSSHTSRFTYQGHSHIVTCEKFTPDSPCSYFEFISEKKCSEHPLLADTTSYCSQEKDKLYYETYDKDSEKPRPLHRMHPYYYNLFQLKRFSNYTLTQEYAFAHSPHGIIHAKSENDIRLIGCSLATICTLESQLKQLTKEMESTLGSYEKEKMPRFNRLLFHVIDEKITCEGAQELVAKYQPSLREIQVEKIFFDDIEVRNILGELITVRTREPNDSLISGLSQIELRELSSLSKGGLWAYRIPLLLQAIARDFRANEFGITAGAKEEGFIELDLDHSQTVIHPTTGAIDCNFGELIPVTRPIGRNEAGVVIGIKTDDLGLGFPVRRLLIIGDLSHSSKGAIRSQECLRINAAIRLAAREKIPIDWFSASYGVQIHRERGVEGLDAAASTLREIVNSCHHKGLQINLIIDEANIGAQSYWDSMAAIIPDTSGILIMTPNGCMALTGPKALAAALYSTVPSEKIGEYCDALYPKGLQSLSGHELVHGPNSDSMLCAKDLKDACYRLLQHHYYGYLKAQDKLALKRPVLNASRRQQVDFDVLQAEMDKFLKGLKPNRMRILEYLQDANTPTPLQFWQDSKGISKQVPQNGDLPQEASTIVQELLIGSMPTLVIFTPTGPLTPADANIITRAIYKANARMQVLIIGSLSGFSCDPLSMENRQLLEGAYIAKAIVEHQGPILICNLGSLVGGTFAVFNKQLQKNLHIIALEGSRVQVIGGKPAAKVVFHSSICKKADQDERIIKAAQNLSKGENSVVCDLRNRVISEIEDKEGIQFDLFHNAQRAMKVKSIDQIVSFSSLKQVIISHFEELRAQYLGHGEHFEASS